MEECGLRLQFFLNRRSIPELRGVVDLVLKNETYSGLIIIVDKNSFELRNMKFLGVIVTEFYIRKKDIGIWGLPYCILQYNILGGNNYTKFSSYLLPPDENLVNYYRLNFNTVQLLECRDCIKFDSCSGLGTLDENLNLVGCRKNKKIAFDNKKELRFKEDYATELNKKVVSHCTQSSFEKTFRIITYGKTFIRRSSSASFDYNDRIIYFCSYLSLDELEREKRFLLTCSENVDFVDYLFEIYHQELYRYAYSVAVGEKGKRESFYLYFLNTNYSRDKIKYLESLGIETDMESDFLRPLHMVGYDFVDNEFHGLKLYYSVLWQDEFLAFIKKEYAFELPEGTLSMIYDHILFVKRYDNRGNFVSFKIELTPCDFKCLSELFTKEFGVEILEPVNDVGGEGKIIALDIDKSGNLNKITTYSGVGDYTYYLPRIHEKRSKQIVCHL